MSYQPPSDSTTAQVAPVSRRTWVPCGCAFLALFLLLALPLIALVIWNLDHGRSVSRRIDAVRQAGEPITYAELGDFYRLPDGAADTSRQWVAGARPLEQAVFEEAAKELPAVGAGSEIPRPGEPWPDLPKAEALLATYAESLEAFHDAAEQGGFARFAVDFHAGLNMQLDHAQRLRAAARLLQLESYVRGHRGDARGCAQSIRTLFAARRSLEYEPVMISQLVSVSIFAVTTRTLADTMTTVPFSDEELQDFRKELRSADHRASLRRAIIGERVMGYEVFQSREPIEDVNLPRLNSDLAMYLEIFEDYRAATDKDFPEVLRAADAVEAKMRQAAGSPVGKLSRIYTLLMTPAIGASAYAAGRSEAYGRAADVAIAVVQYHRKHQQLPSDLGELVPEHLPQVSADPLDGKPLRYRVEAEGFLIYSVGRDLKDDGGQKDDAETDAVLFVPMPRAQ